MVNQQSPAAVLLPHDICLVCKKEPVTPDDESGEYCQACFEHYEDARACGGDE